MHNIGYIYTNLDGIAKAICYINTIEERDVLTICAYRIYTHYMSYICAYIVYVYYVAYIKHVHHMT